MAGMEIAEAFAFFDSCRFWSLTKASAFCAFETPKPQSREAAEGWQPFVRTSVRRKQGESLGAMLCRCAALAAARRASGAGSQAPGFCAGCGSSSRHRPVRLERRLRLALCRECRQGVAEPSGRPR
jgi:hypothetical protein